MSNEIAAVTAQEHKDHNYEVTVIVDGVGTEKHFPAHITVQEAIRRSLPPRDQPDIDKFFMVDGNLGTSALDPQVTLEEAGVRDGHVLSVTKTAGGGGAR